MVGNIQFTRKYSDLSTNQGYQFEFYCDRCGNGFRTRFKPSATAAVSNAMDAANNLFGGVFSKAIDLTERMRMSAWEKAHDEAFAQAVEDLKPQFMQCPGCSSWVCLKSCWNNEKKLCNQCAIDMKVEVAAAQSKPDVEEAKAQPQVVKEEQVVIKERSRPEGEGATCPNCETLLSKTAKFCPKCGTKVSAQAHCAECGAKLPLGAKFCGECGTKI